MGRSRRRSTSFEGVIVSEQLDIWLNCTGKTCFGCECMMDEYQHDKSLKTSWKLNGKHDDNGKKNLQCRATFNSSSSNTNSFSFRLSL
jgi:hypothetical protein